MCVSECWQLDELATCFGVFFVDFCVAKVKERTNILTSAEQYRRITGTERFYDKSDLLANIALQCCFECYANKRRHARYINRHVAF